MECLALPAPIYVGWERKALEQMVETRRGQGLLASIAATINNAHGGKMTPSDYAEWLRPVKKKNKMSQGESAAKMRAAALKARTKNAI